MKSLWKEYKIFWSSWWYHSPHNFAHREGDIYVKIYYYSDRNFRLFGALCHGHQSDVSNWKERKQSRNPNIENPKTEQKRVIKKKQENK